MKRLLILGGDGMLGHRLMAELSARHTVRVTLHRELAAYAQWPEFGPRNAVGGVEASDIAQINRLVTEFKPDAMVNCVGIVKQRDESKSARISIEINALFPHQLADIAQATGCHLVHLSTDCVFSGRRGNYREDDLADAEDIYGRTKWLGEVAKAGCITLRTSIIGPELSRKSGLLEWFLSQQGKTVSGFRKAIFSGFTTAELSRIIEMLLTRFPEASGLYHVSSEPISKYDLLRRIGDRLKLGIDVIPEDSFVCDRSLDSIAFQQHFHYRPPSWDAMIEELARSIRKEANAAER